MTQLGIMPETTVVLYDDEGSLQAARLFLVLDVLGHARVSVLDGGAQRWRAGGGAWTTTVPPAPASSGVSTPHVSADRVAGAAWQMYAADEITPEKTLVTYCQTHHRAAHTYFVLRLLGESNHSCDSVRGGVVAWCFCRWSSVLPCVVRRRPSRSTRETSSTSRWMERRSRRRSISPGHRPVPAILDVHGGAWVREDVRRDEHALMDTALAAKGLVVVAIDFRQSPRDPIRTPSPT